MGLVMIKNDEEIKEEYKELEEIMVKMRDAITELDPEYADEHVGELVSNPVECARCILAWLKGG